MKILYVEDNEMNRDMLSRRLSRRGYEVLLAFDGQAGLDMMKSEKPDLVLMDMGLPVVDGWDATTQAKADPEISSIPIIALTAHALESDKQKALDCGADDFDTKPVDFKRLLSKIDSFGATVAKNPIVRKLIMNLLFGLKTSLMERT